MNKIMILHFDERVDQRFCLHVWSVCECKVSAAHIIKLLIKPASRLLC